jgi:tagatose 6-phosphate kinase
VILCVAPSPAWDVTHHVDRLRLHATNRARSVSARAGGKAVNVARLLSSLGEDVAVVAPLGGGTGEQFARDLALAGIPLDAVPSDAETRRTTTIVCDDAGDATLINESSQVADWPGFVERVAALVPTADVVVASGSLPQGAPVDGYAELCRVAAAHGVPVLVDTSGPALLAALEGGPAIVKPNREELAAVLPHDDPVDAARELAARSGAAVAVSLGPEGLVLACDAGVWLARPGEVLRGNPTGAGDAVSAALARSVAHGVPWADAVIDAVTLSAAAVLALYAGEVDVTDVERLRSSVTLERLDVTV